MEPDQYQQRHTKPQLPRLIVSENERRRRRIASRPKKRRRIKSASVYMLRQETFHRAMETTP
jgi:hypothetical protein